MRLLVSKQNIGLWAARYIQAQARDYISSSRAPFVLGLPTGETVLEMYRFLRFFYERGEMDFSAIITFNMDEYVGLAADDPHSYHFYMKTNLFDFVNLQPNHIHLLDGMADNLQAQCDSYEAEIQAVGGIRLFVGGVGRNGHLAFNEPGSAFTSRTRPVVLEQSTRTANARFFEGEVSQVPTRALSVGIGTILAAKELLFLACGEKKARAVARLAQGEITPDWPITALKTHPNCTLLVDVAAASAITGPLQEKLQDQQKNFPHAPVWGVEI